MGNPNRRASHPKRRALGLGLAIALLGVGTGSAGAPDTAFAPGAGFERSADPIALRGEARDPRANATEPARRYCTLSTCQPRSADPARGALSFGATALVAGLLARRRARRPDRAR